MTAIQKNDYSELNFLNVLKMTIKFLKNNPKAALEIATYRFLLTNFFSVFILLAFFATIIVYAAILYLGVSIGMSNGFSYRWMQHISFESISLIIAAHLFVVICVFAFSYLSADQVIEAAVFKKYAYKSKAKSIAKSYIQVFCSLFKESYTYSLYILIFPTFFAVAWVHKIIFLLVFIGTTLYALVMTIEKQWRLVFLPYAVHLDDINDTQKNELSLTDKLYQIPRTLYLHLAIYSFSFGTLVLAPFELIQAPKLGFIHAIWTCFIYGFSFKSVVMIILTSLLFGFLGVFSTIYFDIFSKNNLKKPTENKKSKITVLVLLISALIISFAGFISPKAQQENQLEKRNRDSIIEPKIANAFLISCKNKSGLPFLFMKGLSVLYKKNNLTDDDISRSCVEEVTKMIEHE